MVGLGNTHWAASGGGGGCTHHHFGVFFVVLGHRLGFFFMVGFPKKIGCVGGLGLRE